MSTIGVSQVPVHGHKQSKVRQRINTIHLNQQCTFVGAASGNHHARPVVLGGLGIVVDGVRIGAPVNRLLGAIPIPGHPRKCALRLTRIAEGDVFPCCVVVGADGLVNIVAFAVVGARAIVNGGKRIKVEGEGVRASLLLDDVGLATVTKRNGLVHTIFKGKGSQIESQNRHAH